MTAHVSSQILGTLDPHQVSSVMNSARAPAGGYPVPGQQSPNVTSAMNKVCFVDDNTWRLIAENGEFDDIVVGSGFCGLAYIDEALRLNPFRRILLLERGGFWLPDHFQNLPLPFQFVQQGVSETFPWELTSETAKRNLYLNGSSPFFGGRSAFWSIWSPRAIGNEIGDDADLMDGFPKFMKDIVRDPDFYKGADRLLNVKRADQIADPVFQSALQTHFDFHLNQDIQLGEGNRTIPGVRSAEPARLATGVPIGVKTTGYRQFSAIGSLLAINERQNRLARQNPPAGKPLMIATDVVVQRFEIDDRRATHDPTHAHVLHTSRGPLTLRGGKTNVILATGAIPATTILLNSLDETIKNRARRLVPPQPGTNPTGQRLTSHFRSTIKARFRPDDAWFTRDGNALPTNPVISACHIRGRDTANDSNLQWHIQLHGAHVPATYQNELDAEEKALLSSRLFTGLAPDNQDTLTPEQMENSEGYVMISCSVLGEQPTDTGSKVVLNERNQDLTTNIRLKLKLTLAAKQLWNSMEKSVFQTTRVIAAGTAVEYWNREDEVWETTDPGPQHAKRVKSLFHEASTSFMTKNFKVDDANAGSPEIIAERAHASVNEDYRPRGLEHGNVYVTGAGLFPTAGSWNPTPTIVGFAQHLAKKLVAPQKPVGVISQDQPVPINTLGHPYITSFNDDGSVSFWSFSGQKLTPPAPIRLDAASYTNEKHVRLLADTTGNGFYDLVVFGDAGVYVATRNGNKFDNFFAVPTLEDFTYSAGWRVDKHIRYMVDITGKNTGRTDVIGFGDEGIILSKNNRLENGRPIFDPPSVILSDLGYSQGWRINKHLRFLANFRGTGRPDIIGFGERDVFLVKNEENGTFVSGVLANLNQFTYSHGWRVDKHVRILADVTGDGLADIVGFGDQGVSVALNRGNGFVGPAKVGQKEFGYPNWRVEKHLRMVVDVNGNKRGDIVGFGEKGVYISKSRGDGTFEPSKLASRDFGYEQGWRVGEHSRFMVDVTGDGCVDIIGFKDGAAYVAFNDGDGNFGVSLRLTESRQKDEQGNPLGVDFKGESSKTVRYVRRLGQ